MGDPERSAVRAPDPDPAAARRRQGSGPTHPAGDLRGATPRRRAPRTAIEGCPGDPGASSFAKLDSQSSDETGSYLQERVLFNWYPSKGTYDADVDVFPQSAKKVTDQLSKGLPNFEEVSHGETTVNSYRGYEVRFKGVFKDTGKGDLRALVDESVTTVRSEVEALTRLVNAFNEMARLPDPEPTPQQFGAYVKAEIAKWGPIVKASGAKAD